MKKKALTIGIIAASCILLFYVLNLVGQDNESKGFKRTFRNPSIRLISIYEFPDHLFGFLWEPTDSIWLMNYKDPLRLIRVDYLLKSIQEVTLLPPEGFNSQSRFMYFDRLGSETVITNHRSEISLLSKDTNINYKIQNLYFDAVTAISKRSVITRGFSNNKKDQHTELTKIRLVNNAEVVKKFTIPKQIDGIFCSDGALHFDQIHSRYLYMYYHRGEFLCLDTNLNLLYKAKTIDTVNRAKIKIGSYNIKTRNQKEVQGTTIISPPNLVSKYITTDQNLIYIYSGLKADNENKSTAFKNEPIDVYALKTGKYLYSIYIPKYKGYTMRQFKVKGNNIVAIYRNFIVTWLLNNNIRKT